MEEMKSQVDLDIERAEEIKRQKDSVRSRHAFCAYQALEVNEFGKELMDYWSDWLKSPVGVNDIQTMAYRQGQNDFIRSLLGMIHDHKNQ